MRPSGRHHDELRHISIETGISKNATGSCIIRCGDTHVVCTASYDSKVPMFLKGRGKGWITAEYGMLPGSTNNRIRREAAQGKQGGRTMEIQRLIGRSLRAAVDLEAMGEYQIIVDCDVIQADGGTRTASVTGGYVALYLAFQNLSKRGIINKIPVINEIAAVSCGIYKGQAILDLDYAEDSDAEVDSNFVITGHSSIIEIQGTAEEAPFSTDQFIQMLELAQKGVKELVHIQQQALGVS